MSAKPFLDSNVLIYAWSTDDPRGSAARSLVYGGGVVSVQVLNEVANVARKKLRRDWADIRAFLALVRERLDEPLPLLMALHVTALELASRFQLSFYDSLILGAAREAGCRILYSEDMQDGQTLDGVRIVNPFSSQSSQA